MMGDRVFVSQGGWCGKGFRQARWRMRCPRFPLKKANSEETLRSQSHRGYRGDGDVVLQAGRVAKGVVSSRYRSKPPS